MALKEMIREILFKYHLSIIGTNSKNIDIAYLTMFMWDFQKQSHCV
jgi:hypothetical protein